MLAGLIFGIDVRFAPDSLVQDLIPDVYYKRFYRRHLTPTFFKTHDLPRPQSRRVIYLVRDGRDAMVSYFHHLTAIVNGSGKSTPRRLFVASLQPTAGTVSRRCQRTSAPARIGERA
jgi:hypothetical protein